MNFFGSRVQIGGPTGAFIVIVYGVDNYTHSETWLQLTVSNVEEATNYLLSNGVETCDEIEELPKNMHWIQDPAGTVFNLQKKETN